MLLRVSASISLILQAFLSSLACSPRTGNLHMVSRALLYPVALIMNPYLGTMDRLVRLCSGFHPFFSAEQSLKSTLLPSLVAASSTRLAINQHVTKVVG